MMLAYKKPRTGAPFSRLDAIDISTVGRRLNGLALRLPAAHVVTGLRHRYAVQDSPTTFDLARRSQPFENHFKKTHFRIIER